MLLADHITLFLSLLINATRSLYQNCLTVHVTDSEEGDMEGL